MQHLLVVWQNRNYLHNVQPQQHMLNEKQQLRHKGHGMPIIETEILILHIITEVGHDQYIDHYIIENHTKISGAVGYLCFALFFGWLLW